VHANFRPMAVYPWPPAFEASPYTPYIGPEPLPRANRSRAVHAIGSSLAIQPCGAYAVYPEPPSDALSPKSPYALPVVAVFVPLIAAFVPVVTESETSVPGTNPLAMYAYPQNPSAPAGSADHRDGDRQQ